MSGGRPAEGEAGGDLQSQVLADGGAGPGAGVLDMELRSLASVPGPVPGPGVERVLEQAERGRRDVAQVGKAEWPSLLHGPDRGFVGEPGRQIGACLRAVLRLDLVPGDDQGDVVPGGVALPLPVDADALAGGLGDQDGQVEPGEQPGGERVRAGGAIDDDVLARPVDQVVEVEINRAGFGVVARDAESSSANGPVASSRAPHGVPTARSCTGSGAVEPKGAASLGRAASSSPWRPPS
jgi:hypothetical protein